MHSTEFRNQKWVSNLSFLVDLTSHLNNLKLQLQGKLQLMQEMWSYVSAFDKKNDFGKFRLEMKIMLTLLHC